MDIRQSAMVIRAIKSLVNEEMLILEKCKYCGFDSTAFFAASFLCAGQDRHCMICLYCTMSLCVCGAVHI